MPNHINEASLPPDLYHFCPQYFQTIKSDGSCHTTGRLIGRGNQISPDFQGQIRQNFQGKLCRKTIGKKWLIPSEFSGQILLEIKRFCADLTNLFNIFFIL